ncbi:inositol 1,4,5-triphosphate receptor associated 2-like [Clupea harengus]|uniref:Inositol 1,4,5-triphosphate receptor associated 2-like n=1 Tax=Clupea harengus TaxID=7950 RepID=A0A8M1KKE0_CLUHA|nr:inositol 1,4,5-triphosphate receptor associated 2-like [Clupea harengus]
MAGANAASSDVTTATSGVNGAPADPPDKVNNETQVSSDPSALKTGQSDATAGQSPPGGDRDSPPNKQKKELQKEQSTEALGGHKAQEDSEVSTATEKEGETSVVTEDASDQEDRRNSWSLSASEKEIETEFHRLSLGFKCDMFTLEKRLRLEERSRDLAEDNVRREVSSCQGLLQVSGARERGVEKEERERKESRVKDRMIYCRLLIRSVRMTVSPMEIIHRLQKNLDILTQSMESRIGRAVEVMIQHVENLRRTYTKEHTELVELRESVNHNERSFGSHGHTDRDDFRNKKPTGSQYFKVKLREL